MSNIFKKIKEQQDRNKIKKVRENKKVFECINKGFDNIDTFRYRVITKDDFIRYFVNSKKAQNINKNTFKDIEGHWNKLRKGYNFAIAVGNEQLMFYSIDSFNKLIGGVIDDKE